MSDLIDRLARLDTCAVSDALDRMLKPGVVLGIRALSVSKRIVGRVVTVQLGSADGRPTKRHLCTAAIDASTKGDVIVVAHGSRLDAAGWGGILSLGAVTKGVNGVIVDGACRDLDESRELGFPLYAREAIPLTARGRVVEIDWNIPVEISGVTVTPGDLVIADGSGVVFIAAESAEEIIDFAEQIALREQAMAEAVRAGRPIVEVMGSTYEELLKMGE